MIFIDMWVTGVAVRAVALTFATLLAANRLPAEFVQRAGPSRRGSGSDPVLLLIGLK
jgi:hypothetical protein